MKPEQVINQDPEIHGGTPVFTGTRVPVKALIDHLKAGESLDYFLKDSLLFLGNRQSLF